MVSCFNPIPMYRQPHQGMFGHHHHHHHQQYPSGAAPPSAWYPPHQQQLLAPPCVEGEHHATPMTAAAWGEKYLGAAGHGPHIAAAAAAAAAVHSFQPDWPQDCNHFQPSPPISDASSTGEGLSPSTATTLSRPQSTRSPFEWMKKSQYQTQSSTGKTRTKDKYRVVYTDHQRLELEKEFHYSRYITIRRKAELATNLGLSERQVKIWFQNRRAKERKQVKKREETEQKIKQETMDPLRNQQTPSGPTPMVLGNAHTLHPSMHGLPLM